MISSTEFLATPAGKRLPEWMKIHPVLTSNNKFGKIFPFLGLKNDIVKDFTTINGVNYSLVFSSTDVHGLWDIATMSMRGVSSCMNWANPHSVHVLGSIVCPVVAIAYLTDGSKTPYGLSINKRVTVRAIFVEEDSTQIYTMGKKLAIHVDRFYTKTANVNPMVYDNKDPNPRPIVKLISDYIKSKVSPNIPVLDAHNTPRTGSWYIPRHKIIDQLAPVQFSFCDAQIPYAVTAESTKLFTDANL